LPSSEAVNEHEPEPTIVTVVLATVQTLVVDEVTVGVSPDVAVTVKPNVAADHVFVPGFVNEIVLVAWATVIVCVVEISPVAEYVMVTEPGVAVTPKPLKVATPDEEVAVPLPTSDPLDTAAVTTFDAEVTLLPPESRTSIIGCVVKALPYADPAALRLTAN
jgi:hypothetical protein